MDAKIIDNDRRILLNIFRTISVDHDTLSIATGYWDLPGMALVIDLIKDYKKIRLLIWQEPMIYRHQTKLGLHSVEADFPSEDIFSDLERLRPSEELRHTVSIIKDMIETGRLEVRVYREKFLHAKCFIFGSYESDNAIGIIGSSNFTKNGLTENAELNTLEGDHRIVTFCPKTDTQEHGHLSWFDAFWEKWEDWTGGFEMIIRYSRVGDMTYSPYKMYLATLHELYHDEIVDHIELSDETLKNLYPFQQRNARLLISKLERNWVAMLSDSVGLGKTITAGAVIRHYAEKKMTRIYTIAPARLMEQWRNDLADKHRLIHEFKILSLQNMDAIKKEQEFDRYKKVDLFVIDEAHNLRNENSTRYAQILEWIANNPDSHVLLLTATPVNNHLTDFVSQIQLASKGKRTAFPVVYETSKKTEVIDFWEAVKRLSTEIKKAENAGEKPDWDRVRHITRDGLRHFLVRSTRSGIEREFWGIVGPDGTIKRFPRTEVKKNGYTFTKKREDALYEMIGKALDMTCEWLDPRKIDLVEIRNTTQRTKHPLDTLGQESLKGAPQKEVFINIFQIVLLLGFAPYRPRTYEHILYGKTPEEIQALGIKGDERFLIASQQSIHNMLMVVLLKRLESSPYALRKSLENYQRRLHKFEDMLNKGSIMSFSDIAELEKVISREISTLSDDEIFDMQEKIEEENSGMKRATADPKIYNISQLKKDISRDKKLLELLIQLIGIIEAWDDKLEAFVKLIHEQKTQFPKSGDKMIVFSFYADTIEYLRDNLPKYMDVDFLQGVAFLSGKDTKEIEQMTNRFSPKSKGYTLQPNETELHTLFATDVLSEGQNLQDSGLLVNYDLHWNPVRMIQRNGRINRLGSQHEEVTIVNMYPTDDLEIYLKLVSTLEKKINRIKNSVGTDQSILWEDALPVEFTDDINIETWLYGNDPEKAFELLISDDTDLLSEDKFIGEYRAWRNNASPEEIEYIEKIPKGKWGYMPMVSRENMKAPSTIGLISVWLKGKKSGTISQTHIFTEVLSDGRVQALTSIWALRYLFTTDQEDTPLMDTIAHDRAAIEKKSFHIAEYKALHATNSEKISDTQQRVLDELSKIFPWRDISHLLMRIDTIQDEKERDTIFRLVRKDIREHGVILSVTLSRTARFIDILTSRIPEDKSVTDTTAILYYSK